VSCSKHDTPEAGTIQVQ